MSEASDAGEYKEAVEKASSEGEKARSALRSSGPSTGGGETQSDPHVSPTSQSQQGALSQPPTPQGATSIGSPQSLAPGSTTLSQTSFRREVSTITSDCPTMRHTTVHQFQTLASSSPIETKSFAEEKGRESILSAPSEHSNASINSSKKESRRPPSLQAVEGGVEEGRSTTPTGNANRKLHPDKAPSPPVVLLGSSGGNAAPLTSCLAANPSTADLLSVADTDVSLYRCSTGSPPQGAVLLREFDQVFEYERYYPFQGWHRVNTDSWLAAFVCRNEDVGEEVDCVLFSPQMAGDLRSSEGLRESTALLSSVRSAESRSAESRGTGAGTNTVVGYGGTAQSSRDAFDSFASSQTRLRRPKSLLDVSCTDGWSWEGPWVVTRDWEYSVFSARDRFFTRKPTVDRWYYTLRRRRWIRHRTKPVKETGAGGALQCLNAEIRSDFFPESGRVASHFGIFKNLCVGMKRKIGKSTRTPGGAMVHAFSGKQAVDFMLEEGRPLLPIGLKNISDFHKNDRESVVAFIDQELRERGLLSSVEPVDQVATPVSATSGNVQRISASQKRGKRKTSAAAAVQQYQTHASSSSLHAVQEMAPFAKPTTKAFEDNATLFFITEASSLTAAETYQGVIDTLMPDIAWLSDISFDTAAPWFKNLTQQVSEKNADLDGFASEHRHRWKSASYQCFRCKDLLIQEGVVTLVCGHFLCTECCKVCLDRGSQNRGQQSLAAALPAPNGTHLLVCNVCHRPSSIKKVTKQNGATGYEADNTLLFVWHLDIVFENQRRTLFSNYSRKHLLPSDRYAYGDSNGARVADPKEATVASADWYYVESWSPQTSENTDSRGWQYAFNWVHGGETEGDKGWSAQPSRLRFVRRRRLQRLRINAPGSYHLREELVKQITIRFNPSTTFSPLYKRVSTVSLQETETSPSSLANSDSPVVFGGK